MMPLLVCLSALSLLSLLSLLQAVFCQMQHITYSSCIYSLHSWLHPFKSVPHPSPHLCLRGLNATTVREHGSNSPALSDSTENTTTRPLIFFFSFLGSDSNSPYWQTCILLLKAMVTMLFLWWWKQSHQMCSIIQLLFYANQHWKGCYRFKLGTEKDHTKMVDSNRCTVCVFVCVCVSVCERELCAV